MNRSVAILVFPGVQALDVSGPLDVFAEANRFLLPGDRYQLGLIGTERGPVACSNGMVLHPQRHFADIDASAGADTDVPGLLLVAGGPTLPERAFPAALYAWLRQASQRAARFGSICNGAFLLAGAGLLDGRTVTTHWNDVAALAARCPAARVEADRIYAQDGSLYTSAGVTAGMDLALSLVQEDLGHAASLAVARELVLFLQRPGNQAQFSTLLQAQSAQNPELRELQGWMAQHLARDLSVPVLAERVAMSPRNFARVFARQVGETPARYVERLRVEAARRLLEKDGRRLEGIARATGFTNADVMRQAFQRHMQTTPERYRAAFRA